ncbi:hypothetical protein BHM03_00054312 [Ensete ventricosum]|nr:hypothetical protein BHM03_00054312 [Ensete ventricosum]
MKFSTRARVGEPRSDPQESRQCYLMATKLPKRLKTSATPVDPRDPDKGTLNPELMESRASHDSKDTPQIRALNKKDSFPCHSSRNPEKGGWGNDRADNVMARHPPRIRATHHTFRRPSIVVVNLAQSISEMDDDMDEANLAHDIIRYKHNARGP